MMAHADPTTIPPNMRTIIRTIAMMKTVDMFIDIDFFLNLSRMTETLLVVDPLPISTTTCHSKKCVSGSLRMTEGPPRIPN